MPGPVSDMSLVELKEDHDLTQVEIAVKVVVKSTAEAIHWEIARIDAIP